MGHLPANLEFVPAAPVRCADVTVYKGLKVLDCKPGDWVAISGIGGWHRELSGGGSVNPGPEPPQLDLF